MLFESMLAIGAVLLIGSGGAKLIDRAPTRGALAAARLPSGEFVVLGLAALEVAAGAGALLVDLRVVPLVLAATYLAFACFVGYALLRDIPIQSCGCFGRVDTPPTTTHIAMNLTFAVAGVVASDAPRLIDRILEAPGAGFGFLTMTLIGAYLTYLMLAELPATLRATKNAT